jgi:membrane protein YdbS with pleckstrin-like domain
MFPAFVENPVNLSFDGQDSDETILLLLRAHPIVNLAWIIPAVIIFFIPFIFPSIIAALNVTFPPLPPVYYPALLIINYLLVIVIVFEGFLHWYFNVNIVTTQNVVDIDFNNLLFKNIDLTPIFNIEEASSKVAGILQLIFNFGEVQIQTAGADIDVDMTDIPHPDRVADFILDLVDKTKHKHGGQP